ncbi:DMSO/selenate family reductase complex B subunit [Shewanella colwelliana]|uniref:DMSO/selenate family reductase complex B subunit n=1 Tax=Shewanella colwelliana TaxID=23 RepID=UPI00049147B4|nr:DMSO/selenate family reductase complex B subunit [Shewanella colwelliana]
MTSSIQKQYGFYVDTTKCTGCKACHVACKDRQSNLLRKMDYSSQGVPELKGVTWRRVYEYGGGTWSLDKDGCFEQDVYAYYTSIGCNHCSEPACVKSCPTGAMHKREKDGFVHIASELCIGCESCAKSCPYDAPQMDIERKVMTKCDGCYDRIELGLKPVCVESCPMRALDFDDMEVLREKYDGGDKHVSPLPPEGLTQPNLIIKSNPLAAIGGKVLNPNEV